MGSSPVTPTSRKSANGVDALFADFCFWGILRLVFIWSLFLKTGVYSPFMEVLWLSPSSTSATTLQGYSYFDLQPPLMEYETDEDFEKKHLKMNAAKLSEQAEKRISKRYGASEGSVSGNA